MHSKRPLLLRRYGPLFFLSFRHPCVQPRRGALEISSRSHQGAAIHALLDTDHVRVFGGNTPPSAHARPFWVTATRRPFRRRADGLLPELFISKAACRTRRRVAWCYAAPNNPPSERVRDILRRAVKSGPCEDTSVFLKRKASTWPVVAFLQPATLEWRAKLDALIGRILMTVCCVQLVKWET